MALSPLDRNSPTDVAGHRALVAGAVLRHLEDERFSGLVTGKSSEVDQRDGQAVEGFFAS